MRYDVCIIFPHGIQYFDEILEILYKYPDLKLLYFREYKPPNFIKSIEEIYRTDTVPWEHIKNKTEYLKETGNNMLVMLIENNAPEEFVVGEGEYRHKQCMLINRFKWEVREKFNPVINGERSEHHVIHATDYEEQTRILWPRFGLDTIDVITSIPNPLFPHVPFFISKFDEYKIIEFELDKLSCSQMQKNGPNYQVPIKDSIYYKYVMGDKEPYINYWKELRGTKLYLDSSYMKFDKLIREIELDRLYNEYIIINENGIVIDGNHRASIALINGIKKLPVIQVKWHTK